MRQKAKNITILLVFALTLRAAVAPFAIADDGGGTVGPGYNPSGGGCAHAVGATGTYWDTCFGASWQYYTTTSDSVSISGNDNVPGGTISGCKESGGYWRLALEQFHAGSSADGSGDYALGKQFGLQKISSLKTYSSGGMVRFFYPGSSSYKGATYGDWDEVRMIFEKAINNIYPTQASKNQAVSDGYIKYDSSRGVYTWGDNAGYFCSSDPTGSPSYTTSSTASINGGTAGQNVSAKISSDKANINFTHKITNNGNADGKPGCSITRTNADGTTESISCSANTIKAGETQTVYNKTDSFGFSLGIGGTICQKITPSGGDPDNTASTACATVYRPYNYISQTATILPSGDSNGVIYAGSKVNPYTNILINKRPNKELKAYYATSTPKADAKLVSFYLKPGTNLSGNTYGVGDSENNILISGGSYQKDSDYKTNYSPYSQGSSSDPCAYYSNIFGGNMTSCSTLKTDSKAWSGTNNNALSAAETINDVAVGTLYCVASGIKTANSGNDSNNGNGTVNTNWNISPANCRVIAKKPMFNVTGGSTAVNGIINTSITTKYKYGGENKTITFSSWDEFAITNYNESVLSKNQGMTSGNTNRTGRDGTYGDEDVICALSPLTIANSECKNGKTGYSFVNVNQAIIERILSKFTLDNKKDDKNKELTNINLNIENPNYTASGRYRYSFLNGPAIITDAPATLEKGTTHIIYSTSNITISTNLNYANTSYDDISDIPQYVIISEGDIKISENVTNIDAWLVSKNGTINTCANYRTTENGTGNLASSNAHCNKKLQINGPVLAKKLQLNRTYGAGAGADSSATAETINLPASSLMWAFSQSRNYPQAYTTYLRELAPRY